MICPYNVEAETTIQQWTKDAETEDNGQTVTKNDIPHHGVQGNRVRCLERRAMSLQRLMKQ